MKSTSRASKQVCLAIAIAFAMLACAIPAFTQSERVLYSFKGGKSDGSSPYSSVIADDSGALYGTAAYFGPHDDGEVFKLTGPSTSGGIWTETILWAFTGKGDGATPTSNLIMDATGALYGTNASGGTLGCGTFFQLVPPTTTGGNWTENTLANFPCSGDAGSDPEGIIRDPVTGVFYGSVLYGGAFGGGWVYRLTPPTSGGSWTYTVLHNFNPYAAAPEYAQGCEPWSVVLGPNGDLYGTTLYCGTGGGVVYKLSPPTGGGENWAETVLYTFGSSATSLSGNQAYGLTFDQGVLYGVTPLGGSTGNGTIYSLSPPSESGGAWIETILHNFEASDDGNTPLAGVIVGPGGVLYGTTTGGGSSESRCGAYLGCGTVFQLTEVGGQWTETILYEFSSTGDDATNPDVGPLLLRSGYLFGMSFEGGTKGDGTVYAVHP